MEQSNLIVCRFQRVAFGVIPSPFLLATIIKHHLGSAQSPIAEKVERNLDVDNAIIEAETVEEAKKDLWAFSSAKMNMCEFFSNSNKFNKFIPESDKQSAKAARYLVLDRMLKQIEWAL